MLLGVMGNPIAHSKSPAMHNAALAACNIHGHYVPLHVTESALKDAVTGIVAMNFRGVNVTVPHKIEVMNYVHELDEAARQIGAVNTIVNQDGNLVGYNTDGIGYIRSLKEEVMSDLKGKSVLVIGCGGAARGIIYALLGELPSQVIVANRTVDSAYALAKEWSTLGNIEGCSLDEVAVKAQQVDLIINTTSVGMHPHIQNCPIEPSHIPSGIVVSDLIYNPLETSLLKHAKLKGSRIHNGFGMFIYQGAYAFEYWTGIPAPIEAMKQAVNQSFTS